MTIDQVSDFLSGDKPIERNDHRRPTFNGARFPELSDDQFIRLVESGRFATHRVNTRHLKSTILKTGRVWYVGTYTYTESVGRGADRAEVHVVGRVGVFKGRLIHLVKPPFRETLWQAWDGDAGWSPTPQDLEYARKILQGKVSL